jgi:hypothetical protein
MKKIALVLAGLLIAVCTVRAECDNEADPADNDQFTLILNSKGVPAVGVVSFCEGPDYVIDTFVLAESSEDKKTHLYVHELVASNRAGGAPIEVAGWKRFKDDLSGCNEILDAQPFGPCKKPGDFTRSVGTGSGLTGTSTATATCAGFRYRICGHSDHVMYDTIISPPNK